MCHSCGKKGSSPTHCEIVTIRDSASATSQDLINLTYNDAGQIVSNQTTEGGVNILYSFSYTSNTEVPVTQSYNGAVNEIDTVTLNADGFMTREGVNKTGAPTAVTTTFYGSNDEVMKSIYTAGSQAPQTTLYSFTNGNLTTVTTATDVTTYTYLSTPIQDGDVLRVLTLIGGAFPFINNKNLCSGTSDNGGPATNYTYTMDSDGKIASAFQGYSTDIFQYSCK